MQTPYYQLQNIKVIDCNFEFDLEALAQHYEFKTNYIDLTKNIEVAEFFAYTYLDDNMNYQPISDFKQYHPHIYRARISDLMSYNKNILTIVGFQAALRPLRQTAMAINLSNGNKTIKDDIFEEIEIELTPEKAKQKAFDIYNKFEGGKKLLMNLLWMRIHNPLLFRKKN